MEPMKHRSRARVHSAYRPIHEATATGYGVSGTTGRSSDSWASTSNGSTPTREARGWSYRPSLPRQTPSAGDGCRSHSPLRDSPGFPPGSLSLDDANTTELRRHRTDQGLLDSASGEPAAPTNIANSDRIAKDDHLTRGWEHSTTNPAGRIPEGPPARNSACSGRGRLVAGVSGGYGGRRSDARLPHSSCSSTGRHPRTSVMPIRGC